MAKKRRKVLHILYRLSIGGMETVLVNMINDMSEDPIEHVIVCLHGYDDFSLRINNPKVQLIDFGKRHGKDLHAYWRMYRLIRDHAPHVVHSYNLGAMEYQLMAFLAQTKLRVHAEHGRDFSDLDGNNRKYLVLRRIASLFITHYISVSGELQRWARDRVGVADSKLKLINNGVDTQIFSPAGECGGGPFNRDDGRKVHFVSVGRFDPIKNQGWLIECFAGLCKERPEFAQNARLLIIGEGSLESRLQSQIDEHGLAEQIRLVRSSNQVAAILRCCEVFVLSSLAEGTPMTLLEAMASALPVISTDVGGIPDVVVAGESGELVKSEDGAALQSAMLRYFQDEDARRVHGLKGREIIEARYSLRVMADEYRKLYA